MTKELWKGRKQATCKGAYSPDWSGDPTSAKLGSMWQGGASTSMGPSKYPSMDDLAHEPGPTPNKYVRNKLNPGGLGQVHVPHGDPQYAAGIDDGKHTIQKWHGDGGFSGPMMGKKPMTYSNKLVTNVNRKMYQNTTGNHPDWGSDTGSSRRGASGSAKGTRKGGVGGENRPGRGKLFTGSGDLSRKARGGQGTDSKSAPKGSHKYSWR